MLAAAGPAELLNGAIGEARACVTMLLNNRQDFSRCQCPEEVSGMHTGPARGLYEQSAGCLSWRRQEAHG